MDNSLTTLENNQTQVALASHKIDINETISEINKTLENAESTSTKTMYQIAFNDFAKFVNSNNDITGIDTLSAKAYINFLKKTKKLNTVLSKVSALKTIFKK